jgi:glycosyltransferase involved in cell wall biosynthesis
MPLEYVLITPARNEAALIESTIRSVVSQTLLPKRWIIVSDGSTDDTDGIVQRYLPGRDWLELVHLPVERSRSFAAKVHVFNEGYRRLANVSYDIIGNLDADITVPDDYFACLVDKFADNPRLGVAGTHYVENGFHSYDDSFMSIEHVNGGCQLFRRECFEDIGGYIPIPGGGIDWAAVTTARMKGWTTRSFPDRVFHHHRAIGTAESNVLASRFHYGKKDYSLGNHPLWELMRGTFQMTKTPYVVGGLSLLLGYVWCALTAPVRPIPSELVRFHRREQLSRLRGLLAAQRRPQR